MNTLHKSIGNYDPIDGSWGSLEDLFEQVFSTDTPSEYYPAIFSLFERYPDDDGCGVFWSALHGMEHIGGYEVQLAKSHQQAPSMMSDIMLSRLQNGGILEIDGINISSLIDTP